MKKPDSNFIIFIVILLVYIAGQLLIGTYHPDEKRLVYDAPADVDFLYYGAIINTVLDNMPPENPAFAGVKLTQPFIQYYPAAILAKILNPYNSIRILNLLYLILFWLLLKSLFPARYGPPLAVLFSASVFAVDLNALGVDFVARGFTHAPFFILLTAAIFCKRLPLRLISIFAAAMINGYSMLMVLPFLAVMAVLNRKRDDIYLLVSGLLGTIAASLIVTSAVTEKPFYFVLTEAFYFDPLEILKHAAPFIILAAFYRRRDMSILLAIALIFGSLIHFNPFFPIFMVYFAGAMIVASGEPRLPAAGLLARLVVIVLFVGFIIACYSKYNPNKGDYYPRYDSRLDKAVSWINQNTDQNDCFMAVTADSHDMALVMQSRPVYLGFIGHVSHLGLSWRERYNNITKAYRMSLPPPEVDYIFYGPVESKYFPHIRLTLPVAYQDEHVLIYKTEK